MKSVTPINEQSDPYLIMTSICVPLYRCAESKVHKVTEPPPTNVKTLLSAPAPSSLSHSHLLSDILHDQEQQYPLLTHLLFRFI